MLFSAPCLCMAPSSGQLQVVTCQAARKGNSGVFLCRKVHWAIKTYRQTPHKKRVRNKYIRKTNKKQHIYDLIQVYVKHSQTMQIILLVQATTGSHCQGVIKYSKLINSLRLQSESILATLQQFQLRSAGGNISPLFH